MWPPGTPDVTEPLASSKPDAAATPLALGGYRLFDRLSVASRSLGAVHLGQREPGAPALVWWADSARHPMVGAVFADVTRSLSTIVHPNVIALRDAGETGSLRWMAFPYVLGETIESLLDHLVRSRTTLPWMVAAQVIAEAARGMGALHACRSGTKARFPVHGALTGESFVVGYDGHARLFDPDGLFVRRPAPAEALAYSSPERVWNEPSDARADVFSLGVLLWELCAGRRLFRGRDGDETRALLEAHVVAPLAARFHAVPPKLDTLIGRAVARETGARIASPGELARQLEALLGVGESSSEDVAVYMHATFGERERHLRQQLAAAAESTDVNRHLGGSPGEAPAEPKARQPSRIPPPPSVSMRGAVLVPISSEDVTIPHELPTQRGTSTPIPVLDDGSALDERTIPRLDVSGMSEEDETTTLAKRPFTKTHAAPAPTFTKTHAFVPTFDTAAHAVPPSFETRTGAIARPVSLPTRELEAETLPRISGVNSIVLGSEELVSVVDSSPLAPSFRDRADAGTQVETSLSGDARSSVPDESPAAVPGRGRLRPPSSEFGGMRDEFTPTRLRPETRPRRAFMGISGQSPSRPPESLDPAPDPREESQRRSKSSSPPARRPSQPPAGTEGASVRPPPPVPAPPRPPARSVPPPAPIESVQNAPNPPIARTQPIIVPQPIVSMRPELVGAAGTPPAAPPPLSAASVPSPVSVPNGPAFVSAGFIAENSGRPAPESAFPMAQPAPSAPGFPLRSGAPPPSSLGFAQATDLQVPSSLPPSREPLLLPRDPQLPAMQRALIARDAARETDRRIVLPVIGMALAVAVCIAIGIPLFARRQPSPPAVMPASTESTASVAAAPAPAPSPPPPAALPTLLSTGLVPSAAPPPVGTSPSTRAAAPAPPLLTVSPGALPDTAPPRANHGAHAGRPHRAERPEKPPARPRGGAAAADDDLPEDSLSAAASTPSAATNGAAKAAPSAKDSSGGARGLLTVICNPACDDVLDGTRSLGGSPVFKAPVSAGPHRLTLRISDPPLEKVVNVSVTADETTVLTQPMTK